MIDALPQWDLLDDFESFVWLGYGHAEHVPVVMICVYGDESADHRDPEVYSVCGTLGLAPDWFELGRRWRQALKEEGLADVGFHMGPCEAGRHPPYDVMDRQRRDELQRKFVGLINSTQLWTCSTAIRTKTDFPKLKAFVEAHPAYDSRSVLKPHYAAFTRTVQWLANTLDRTPGVPGSEPISFEFDQQKEYEGIAKTLYDLMQQDTALPFRHRLGSLQFASRLQHVQLQAADVIAYESMRYVREVEIRGGPPRWQADLLFNNRQHQAHAFILQGNG